ncbi:MAG: ATP synthase F0 subunit B, partial [Planctomycetia bacterium]|nr:ATP synthase F0 subunit B [Planctomycetia bacterium]
MSAATPSGRRPGWSGLPVLAYGWLAAGASPLLAAAEKHAEHKSGGIDIFEPRFDLGVWTIIVFLGLFFVLKKYAWGPLIEGLDKREQRIHGALEEAKLARAETEKVRVELQKKLDAGAETVREMIEEARRDAKHTKDEMIAEARKEIQTERDRLHRELETAKDQALHEIYTRTVQLATAVSSKA